MRQVANPSLSSSGNQPHWDHLRNQHCELRARAAGGNIIQVASVVDLIGLESRFPYSASKGTVISTTRSIAIDFATKGIRCNAFVAGSLLVIDGGLIAK